MFRGGVWLLTGSNSTGFTYGQAGDIPVCGDWNGDGKDSPGVVRGNVWYLTNQFDGSRDITAFSYGNASGDTFVVGNWNGSALDNTDGVGVFRSGTWYLTNALNGTQNGPTFAYGNFDDRPVVGDWDGNGADGVAVVRGITWYMNNSLQNVQNGPTLNSLGELHRHSVAWQLGRWAAEQHRHARRGPMRRRHLVVASVTAAVAAACTFFTSAAAQQEKPGTSSEFNFSPPSGPPGTDQVSGKCEWQGAPAERAFVALTRRADDGGQPLGAYRSYPVRPDTTFVGDLPVPQEFPPGEYHLSLTCYTTAPAGRSRP